VAREAGRAATARVAWFQGDAVPWLHARHLGPDGDDGACGFVPEYHGLLDDEGPDAAVLPVVHVAAADACVVDGDEDIVGGVDGRLGPLLEFDVEPLGEDEGEVLVAVGVS